MNYTLIKKIFLFFGIDMDGRFEGRAHILRFLAIWKRIILLFMVIGVIQIWVHLIGSLSNELKNVILLTQISNKSMKLTAMNFFSVDLSTCATVSEPQPSA
jgi:signal transduction histidine kinase